MDGCGAGRSGFDSSGPTYDERHSYTSFVELAFAANAAIRQLRVVNASQAKALTTDVFAKHWAYGTTQVNFEIKLPETRYY